MIQKSYKNDNCLYLIPTPIGNFDDITLRALQILKDVDYVLCEDTRVTKVLLNHFDISKKLVSCHEHNESAICQKIYDDINSGMKIGLVTDQGSPIISDPGAKVVKYLTDLGVSVIALPGATAFVPTIMTSGIDSTNFMFYGFLDSKQSRRKKELENLKTSKIPIVFYESVHRLKECLKDIYDIFGDRQICIARELSKIHEEIIRGKLSEVIKTDLTEKGEFVLFIEGSNKELDFSDMSIVEHVKMYMDEGNEEKDAIKLVAKDRGVKKSDIYKEYHLRK